MKQLSPMDSAFLGLESATMTGNIGSVMVLDPRDLEVPFDREYLKTLIAERIPLLDSFHQRLRKVPFGIDRPYWVDDSDFDMDYHVRAVALPEPGDLDELMTFVARVHERPLDQDRPLWEVYLITGLPCGRVAVYTKTHHVVVDGVSGIELMTVLTDTDPSVRPAPSPPMDVEAGPSQANLLGRALVGLAKRPSDALKIAKSLAIWSPNLVSDTGWSPTGRATRGEEPEDGSHAGGLPLRTPATPFNVKISVHRRFGVSDLSLPAIREIKSTFGTSVNDVVMAATAGAVRRWLIEKGSSVDHPLVCLVPVAVKGVDRSHQGNYVTAMLVTLPVHLTTARERLLSSRTFTTSAKKKGAAIPPDALVGAMNFAPPVLFGRAARAIWENGIFRAIRPFNLIVSNVPGSAHARYLAGATIEAMYPVSVVGDGMGVNVAVLGYGDTLHVGITVCRDAVPDVQRIADWMVEEVENLLTEARSEA